jgi:hypothetical protein
MIQMINMLLCISAVIAAFFSRSIAWGILLFPFAYLLFTAFATRSAKLKHIAELSDNANAMLKWWHHYYLHPGFCVACRAVGLSAPAVAIIGCFYGSYFGLAFGIAICLLTFNLAPVFNPTNSLRHPIDRQAHEEVIAFINQKLEDPMSEAATPPSVVPASFPMIIRAHHHEHVLHRYQQQQQTPDDQ